MKKLIIYTIINKETEFFLFILIQFFQNSVVLKFHNNYEIYFRHRQFDQFSNNVLEGRIRGLSDEKARLIFAHVFTYGKID